MLQTILVPLDGSSRAEAALPVARRIAHNTGATLVLVRVVSFLSEYWPAVTSANPSLAQAVVETDLEQATAYLEEVAASAEFAGITVKNRRAAARRVSPASPYPQSLQPRTRSARSAGSLARDSGVRLLPQFLPPGLRLGKQLAPE